MNVQKYDEESARNLYNLLDSVLSNPKNKIPNSGDIRVKMCEIVSQDEEKPVIHIKSGPYVIRARIDK